MKRKVLVKSINKKAEDPQTSPDKLISVTRIILKVTASYFKIGLCKTAEILPCQENALSDAISISFFNLSISLMYH